MAQVVRLNLAGTTGSCSSRVFKLICIMVVTELLSYIKHLVVTYSQPGGASLAFSYMCNKNVAQNSTSEIKPFDANKVPARFKETNDSLTRKNFQAIGR